jgi:hypothetical protein
MERSGQSWLGVASLLISAANYVVTFLNYLVAGIVTRHRLLICDENSFGFWCWVMLGLLLFGGIGVNLVSIGLGVAGILQKQRGRICAVVGTSLATASLITFIGITAIGMALES